MRMSCFLSLICFEWFLYYIIVLFPLLMYVLSGIFLIFRFISGILVGYFFLSSLLYFPHFIQVSSISFFSLIYFGLFFILSPPPFSPFSYFSLSRFLHLCLLSISNYSPHLPLFFFSFLIMSLRFDVSLMTNRPPLCTAVSPLPLFVQVSLRFPFLPWGFSWVVNGRLELNPFLTHG